MAWYRAGTVTVTNGAAAVTGAGTDFVSFASSGDSFRGPDGRSYEIARVVSATELTLAEPYVNGTGGGQPFAIQPTQSYIRDLALNAGTLLATFSAVRDGVGQGLFGGGSPVAPGIRFAADPDTGFFNPAANVIGVAAGGRGAFSFQSDAFTLLSSVNDRNLTGGDRSYASLAFTSRDGVQVASIRAVQQNTEFQDAGSLAFHTSYGASPERMRLDSAGNLLLGVTSGATHTVKKGASQGDAQLHVFGSASFSVGSGSASASASASVMVVSFNTATGRSISAGGTLNASGADYAEYMTKAAGCGTIAPGDVCGVDLAGRLTRNWADAISFVVKSTDPAYVGGDSWTQHLPPRPEAPGAEPVTPIAPDLPLGEDGDAALAAWRSATAAYSARMAAYPAARAAWQAAADAYARDLAAWEAALEAERVKVDRIAFCGQVPVNVTGDFAVGDYLTAAEDEAGIKAVAVPEADISFDQYRRRLGKVWAVRDGRAWVDVQHG